MAHATWCENRDGELFFMEADSTAAGWVFSERRAGEVCWSTASPNPGWIEKADGLVNELAAALTRGHVKGNPPKPAAQIEVGDYFANTTVLTLATWKINAGELEDGLAMLNTLRTNIVRSEDQQSRRLLLPAVEEAIERQLRRQTEKLRQAESAPLFPGTAGETPAFAESGPSTGHAAGDLVSRFKLHMIDVVAIVTALVWTHSMLVHEITTLPGLTANPTGANVVAGSVLAIVLRLVSRTGRL